MVAGGTALSPVADLLETVAPLSWRARHGRSGDGPETVTSPHGDATVNHAHYHVPHVEADGEPAAYFALGYIHAADYSSRWIVAGG